jgi:hypothetical protein
MLGSTYIEMAIGLALMYLMLSLMCSIAWEWIAKQGAVRAEMLRSAIRQMLGSDASSAFYVHPLIRGLGTVPAADPSVLSPWLFRRRYRYGWNAPSFIPPDLFAQVLGDVMEEHPQAAIAKDVWASFRGGGQVDPKAVAAWFDAAMKRLTSRYQRTTQAATFLLALPLVVAFNADSILVANRLLRDKSLRDTIVGSAAAFVKEHPDVATTPVPGGASAATPAAPAGSAAAASPPAPSTSVAAGAALQPSPERLLQLAAQLEKLSLPIGWVSKSEVEKAKQAADEAEAKLQAAKRRVETARATQAALAAEVVPLEKPAAEAQIAKRRADREVHEKMRAQRLAKANDPAAKQAVDEAKALAANAMADAADRTADATEAQAAADKAQADLDKARTDASAAAVASEAARAAASEINARAWPFARVEALSASQALLRVAGGILTALAISLGAGFWFDTLGKLFSIRGAGEKPAKPGS